MEMIEVKSGKRAAPPIRGSSGPLQPFVECCLRKKALPGFHKKGLIADAKLKDKTLTLTLSGKHTGAKLTEMMEIALLNIGAYPDTGSKADFLIEVQSEK